MTDKDFKECDFINSEMKFYTYDDFKQNCVAIKRLYDNYLGRYGKIFYKWFVFANIHIAMNLKNKIWAYLNGDMDKKDL